MMTIQDVIQRILQNKETLGITLYPPAKESAIDDLAKTLNISFPIELKEFYLFCNGFESEEDMFRIVPLKELRHIYKQTEGSKICIAEYLVYCDYWEMAIDKNNGSYVISNGVILSNSLIEFLDRFLTAGVFGTDGLYDWKDSVITATKKPLK